MAELLYRLAVERYNILVGHKTIFGIAGKSKQRIVKTGFNLAIREEEYAAAAKAMVIPVPKPKETLPVDTPLNLAINLNRPGSYILCCLIADDGKNAR